MFQGLSFITLNMILSLLFFALSVVMPFFVVLFSGQDYSLKEALEVFMKYALFFNVGCLFIAGALGQLLYASDIAADLNWSWSPFQSELGFSELALGILGLLGPLFQKEFWLATIIATAVWLFGASAVHLYYLFVVGNQAIMNASFVIAWNIVIAFWLIGLYVTYKHAEETEIRPY